MTPFDKLRMTTILLVGLVSLGLAQEVVRSEKTTTVDGKMYYVHTVQQGQTLYSVAKAYDVSVKSIIEANHDALDGLKAGQEIKIPYSEVKRDPEIVKQEEKSPRWKSYKVEKGDTWFSIAKKYNITVEQLKAFNAESSDQLKTGQEIRIPTIGTIKKEKDPVKKGNPPPDPKNVVVTSPTNDTVALKKPEYNIGFLLPFNLGTADLIDPEKIKKGSRNFPEKAKLAIEFYHGTQMAIDSLVKNGVKVKAWYFDTGTDSIGSSWIKDPMLQKMDLLVGPFYTNSFNDASKLAKKLGITIVTPTLQNNKILIGNPQVNKASASVYTQMEEIGKYVALNYRDQNILLVSSGGPKDQTLVNAVRNAGVKADTLHSKDSMKVVNGLSGVLSSLVKEKINVVVLPSNNQSYVTDFISKLYKTHLDRKDSIIVFGMNAWSTYDNLDPEYLNGMNLHYPSNSFVNYRDSATIGFIQQYRTAYKTEPTDYVYDGFDIAWYYSQLLNKQGMRFNSVLPANVWEGVNMRFRYTAAGVDSGYENLGVFILRYKDLTIIKAN